MHAENGLNAAFNAPGAPFLELSEPSRPPCLVHWGRGRPAPPAFVCRGGDLLAGSQASLFQPLKLAFAPNGRQRGPAGPRRALVSICGQDRV